MNILENRRKSSNICKNACLGSPAEVMYTLHIRQTRAARVRAAELAHIHEEAVVGTEHGGFRALLNASELCWKLLRRVDALTS